MASSPSIGGFNADAVRNGLRLAMQVGLPPTSSDQPTFYMPLVTTSTEPLDQSGVPFDPSYQPTRATRVAVTVPCAIEYHDNDGKLENFGVIVPAKVKLILLDQDYAKVKGFEYVVIAGIRYFYRRTETPIGLISVGVYTVHCVSEDEG